MFRVNLLKTASPQNSKADEVLVSRAVQSPHQHQLFLKTKNNYISKTKF